MKQKQCPRCESPKPESEFYVSRKRADGLTLYCKQHCLAMTHKTREIERQRRPQRAAQIPERKKAVKAKPVRLIEDGSVDAGLLILSLVTPYGATLTLEEIGFVCGCYPQNISQIEQRALRKLRNAFLSDSRINQFLRGQMVA